MKYANYANYLIKYAFYRETPGLIEFYRKNYIRLNLGTFDTPRHKILTGFPLSNCADLSIALNSWKKDYCLNMIVTIVQLLNVGLVIICCICLLTVL